MAILLHNLEECGHERALDEDVERHHSFLLPVQADLLDWSAGALRFFSLQQYLNQ